MDPVLKRGAVFNPDELSSNLSSKYWGGAKDDSAHPPMYLWCRCCERTYRRGEYQLVVDRRFCPYIDCHGDAAKDAWDWDLIRVGTDYPKHPLEGARYPRNVFGFSHGARS